MSDNAKTLVERLKGLAAKATPGPWGIYPKGGLHHPSWIMYPGQEEKAKIEHATGSGLLCWGAEEDDDPGAAYGVAWRGGRADEEFIAASREGVPALIDEITRLERELAEARRERDESAQMIQPPCSNCEGRGSYDDGVMPRYCNCPAGRVAQEKEQG